MREYINIKNVGNNNGEIVNKFNWDITFTYPLGVLGPSMDIFKGRLISIGGLPADTKHTIDHAEAAGGFQVSQIGDASRDPVQVSLEFQDYDDEKISSFFLDWDRAQTNPYNKRSQYKTLMVCQMIVYQLNTGLIPIKRWILRNGLLASQSTGDSDFGNKKELSGKVSASIDFEWWDYDYAITPGVFASIGI